MSDTYLIVHAEMTPKTQLSFLADPRGSRDASSEQTAQWDDPNAKTTADDSTTFIPNQGHAVHRWFRYSAGFSATWAEEAIRSVAKGRRNFMVLDPFAGVGTTLLAAQRQGVKSTGIEAHPFVHRVASAKLDWSTERETFASTADGVLDAAEARAAPAVDAVPRLISQIYEQQSLVRLYRLKQAVDGLVGGTPSHRLTWLALASILRSCSTAGTAPWQYVLPRKTKARVRDPYEEFSAQVRRMYDDMGTFCGAGDAGDAAVLMSDARTCEGVPDRSVDLVLTSPPYPNNYDYADATRVEMSFFGEVQDWSDLHEAVRRHLIRSCSQHTSKEKTDAGELLQSDVLAPIRSELVSVCAALSSLRQERAGKKTYDSMIAAYFLDMGRTLKALSRVMKRGGVACLVIGDSAPYGVYVPVDAWLTSLAAVAGFRFLRFEETRKRNTKWKNRKHRVLLREGRLWLEMSRPHG